jgi:hypothetical protein
MSLGNTRRRIFFDDFAKSKHFDPLDVEKWYSVTKREIVKAVSGILFMYDACSKYFIYRVEQIFLNILVDHFSKL